MSKPSTRAPGKQRSADAGDEQELEPPVEFDSVCLADVKPEQVSWLWDRRIPYGKLTIIEGHPGVGKSTLTLEIAARVSRGDALPGGETIPIGNVLLLTAEDGLADTVRPRLDAAGANPFKIHALQKLPTIPEDIPALEQYVKENYTRLLIIDPLNAYLAGEVNSFKDHDIRRALAPLAAMAEHTGCAIVVVRHLTKASNGQAIVAGGGSIGIIGQARCAMLVAADPENPSEIVLAVVKNNLAAKPESLKFRLASDESGWARIEWIGFSPHTADALIAAGRDGEDAGPIEEAMQLLAEWLRNGPLPKADLLKSAKAAGLSTRTLERAKQKLGVVHRKNGYSKDSRTTWELPSSPEPSLYTSPRGEYEDESPSIDSDDNDLAYSPNSVASKWPELLTAEDERDYLESLERLT